jgi:hypothetical protein
MTTLPDPIVVLSGINPAGAPTSEPGQLPPSLPQETVLRELVARRLGALHTDQSRSATGSTICVPKAAATCLKLLVLEERPCGSRG